MEIFFVCFIATIFISVIQSNRHKEKARQLHEQFTRYVNLYKKLDEQKQQMWLQTLSEKEKSEWVAIVQKVSLSSQSVSQYRKEEVVMLRRFHDNQSSEKAMLFCESWNKLSSQERDVVYQQLDEQQRRRLHHVEEHYHQHKIVSPQDVQTLQLGLLLPSLLGIIMLEPNLLDQLGFQEGELSEWKGESDDFQYVGELP
ncbi:MAG: hypothetical protein ACRC5C_02170, partial [Bacilli bacterium]